MVYRPHARPRTRPQDRREEGPRSSRLEEQFRLLHGGVVANVTDIDLVILLGNLGVPFADQHEERPARRPEPASGAKVVAWGGTGPAVAVVALLRVV